MSGSGEPDKAAERAALFKAARDNMFLGMAVVDENGQTRYPSEPFEMRPVSKQISLPTPEGVRQAQYTHGLPRSGPSIEGVLIDGLGVEFVAPIDYKLVTRQSRLFELGMFNDVAYDEASPDSIQLVSEARGRPTWVEIGWAKNYSSAVLFDLAGGQSFPGAQSYYKSTDSCLHFEHRAPAPSTLEWLNSSDSAWTTRFVPSGIFQNPFPTTVLVYQGATSGTPGQIWTVNRKTPWGDPYTYFIHLDSLAFASDDWELLTHTWKWKSLADYGLA